MRWVRPWVWIAAFGLCVVACAHGSVPAPGLVIMVDDAEDAEGSVAIVRWTAPGKDADGLALVGYEVALAEGDKEFEVVALLPDPAAAEYPATGLSPWWWKRYSAQVKAIYLPQGEAPEITEDDPLVMKNVGAVRSAGTVSEKMLPVGEWYRPERTNVLVWVLVYSLIVIATVYLARTREMYIRPIAGLQAVNDAIGRATEMGRPILFVTGLTGLSDVATIASMLILGHLAKRTAAYETPILVPCYDPLVMTVEREIVRDAYTEAGKPQNYEPDNVFYLTDSQFGYVAAVDGIMIREKPAANFFMGGFYAEALMLAETGASTGAIQIAGTDSDTQLPFFITACDYTLMGEELYAASAYLSRNPLLIAQLKGQDIGKVLVALTLIVGTIAATLAAIYPEMGIWQAIVDWFEVKG